MNFGRYTFTCSFLSNAALPDFKAAIFRDCFGRALKQSVCVLRSCSCDDCLLNSKCLYATVFENNHGGVSSRNESPHPFVLEPPETRATRFSPEDSFSFHLLLFGDTTSQLPYFVHAVQLMGEKGFGRRSGGIFSINTIRCGEESIYSEIDQILHQPPAIDLDCHMDLKTIQPVSRLRIQLLTPLRLKYQNRLASHLPFHLLIRAGLRRASTLLSAFGDGEPNINYADIVTAAQQISVLKSNLFLLNWKGYSFRQKQEIHLGGLIGDVIYEGDISRFLPILNFCRKTHIGKQSTFGLGRFDMDIVDTDFAL